MKRMTPTVAAAAVLALTLAALVSGCAPQASQNASRLIGTWFDDHTGSPYRFVSDTVLVEPQETAGGGNAITYTLTGTNGLDIASGGAHRVSVIDQLTPARLVLADPITDARQVLLRDAGQTRFAADLAKTAVAHASTVGSIGPSPIITWVAPMPKGKAAAWTAWPPVSLGAYASEWDWSSIKRAARVAITANGTGPDLAFAFTLQRKVPTGADLEASRTATPPADSSTEPTSGLKYIDVGYSASKTDYAAGTLVYLPGGLIYSLGDGYAIPIGLDAKHKSFVPLTHD
jgi:hypothetical protein